jgi:hypothetical protein
MNRLPRIVRTALALAALAAGPSPALAQLGPGGGLLSLNGVQITGAGCPAPASISAMLVQSPMGMTQLQIAFPMAPATDMDPAPFRAAGPNGESSCTVAMVVMLPPEVGPFSLGLDGAVARIQFANPTPRGQLTIRSAARINDASAPQQTTRVPAQGGATLQAMELPLEGLRLRADVQNQLDLRATLTLGVRGARDTAQLLLEGLTVNLTPQRAAGPPQP